ncbi:AAA domain-containing protein [Chenggangzhangella methanolivorans]
MSLDKTKADLKNVLLYASELLTLNERIIYDLGEAGVPAFYEADLIDLEGVETSGEGETWMRMKRLRETQPPAPDTMFTDWIVPVAHPTPDKKPELLPQRVLRLSIEEISDLCEAGLIGMDDVLRPLDADEDHPSTLDVILRPATMSEFQSLFAAWIDGPWEAWAKVERPRRLSISVYNKIYQIQQRQLAAGDDNQIELVWGVGMARWKHERGKLSIPVLEQLVDVELEEDGSLSVMPRQASPVLNLKAFHALDVEGSKAFARDAAEQLQRVIDDPDILFSPFTKKTFETILKSAAARLSASGVYVPDEEGRDETNRKLSVADDTLRISDTWVLYARNRAEDFRKADISKLIRSVEGAEKIEEIPEAGVRFVTPPSDEKIYGGGGIDLGQASWRAGVGEGSGVADLQPKAAHDFFFPLATNADQEAIAYRLEEDPAVHVMGPPGTGKTHLIGNIISHYLACGKRVLVTAKSAEALVAVREKLPEGIRALAISVIHSDREGAGQLEEAIQMLASEAKQINVAQVSREIGDKQNALADVSDRIKAIDVELIDYARRNLEKVSAAGSDVLPMDLARTVVEGQSTFLWFTDDLDLGARFEPQFGDGDIRDARAARIALGDDIAYRSQDLPIAADLPDMPNLLAAHRDLLAANLAGDRARSGETLIMATGQNESARQAQVWIKALSDFAHGEGNEPWAFKAYRSLARHETPTDASTTAVRRFAERAVTLSSDGDAYAMQAIDLGTGDPNDPEFSGAVAALARGENPFGVFSFGKGQLKASIAIVRVMGTAPASRDEWTIAAGYVGWLSEIRQFSLQWNALAPQLGLPVIPEDRAQQVQRVIRLGEVSKTMLSLASEAEDMARRLQTIFPYGLDVNLTVYEAAVKSAKDALEANLGAVETATASAVKERLIALAGRGDTHFNEALEAFAGALGDEDVDVNRLSHDWSWMLREAARLQALYHAKSTLEKVAAKVASSGARRWASHLLGEPATGQDDAWTPADWRGAWEWSRASGFIRAIGDRDAIRKLSDERAELEGKKRRLLAEVVRLRTFLGLKSSLTARIETALAKFASAVAKLGAGTGKSAPRQRRVIRDAAFEAANAVPCWIMPEWRISEQIPASLAAFDLVIVDEASQSDITALPALLRGKKILIVGDDKQVSPTPIGLEERTVIQLRTTYLEGLPYADQLDPSTSLYELASIIFPGKAIMLKEHFRCIEPIIRFSSRFYHGALIPMRLPSASQRLDPPLIDILVKNGRRDSQINLPEVDAVIEELRRIVADPAMERRTVGVISLVGDKQVKVIQDRAMAEFGAEIFDRHHLMFGSAAKFQGAERDIIILSMVVCSKTVVTSRARLYEQRFNVAMSRARDRMILVRSVTSSDLKQGDLKLAVIEHFRNPMGEGGLVVRKDVLELCESGFEKDFAERMLGMGYRLQAQVPVGGFRIDFVVEGANDRRLAIELDGDKWHGPDVWAADFRRQQALERLGWTFWRCWGSNWIADKDACMADLKRTLAAMEIEPIGSKPLDGVWTEFREVGETAAEIQDAGASATSGADALAGRNELFDAAPATPPAVDNDRLVAQPGDLVVLRYDDEPNRALRVTLSRDQNRPEEGIVHISEPLGLALVGVGEEEEIEVDLGSRKRTGIIERIERHSALAA